MRRHAMIANVERSDGRQPVAHQFVERWFGIEWFGRTNNQPAADWKGLALVCCAQTRQPPCSPAECDSSDTDRLHETSSRPRSATALVDAATGFVAIIHEASLSGVLRHSIDGIRWNLARTMPHSHS